MPPRDPPQPVVPAGSRDAAATPLAFCCWRWRQCSLPLSAQAQETIPALKLSEPWFQAGTPEHTWKYRVDLTNVREKTTFTLKLRIPELTRVHDINEGGVQVISRRQSPFTEVDITVATNTTIHLVVTGAATSVQHGSAAEHQWRVGNGTTQTSRASAPEQVYDPSLVRVMFGIGGEWLIDDPVDFRVSEDGNTLRVLNDSRIRTTATVGVLFNVSAPFDIFASFNFTTQTAQPVDGAMFGVAWSLNKLLSVGVGYALRTRTELSPGFRKHASVAISSLPPDERYKAFKESDLASDQKYYDGFPLKDDKGKDLFPGFPLTSSTNHSFFAGVFVPFDFREWFTSRTGT